MLWCRGGHLSRRALRRLLAGRESRRVAMGRDVFPPMPSSRANLCDKYSTISSPAVAHRRAATSSHTERCRLSRRSQSLGEPISARCTACAVAVFYKYLTAATSPSPGPRPTQRSSLADELLPDAVTGCPGESERRSRREASLPAVALFGAALHSLAISFPFVDVP